MKRSFDCLIEGNSKKKIKPNGGSSATGFVDLDENLLYEVLKHVDARTLGVAACVAKMWSRTAQDERLWELICTAHWCSVSFAGGQQLRSVVLALGGFRRLHSLYIWPLTRQKILCTSGGGSLEPAEVTGAERGGARWGKDEVHLSLSLLSIRFYEKMNFPNRGK